MVKTIDSFRDELNQRKQHRIDETLSKKDREIKLLSKQYQDLLNDYQVLKTEFDVVSGFQSDYGDPLKIHRVRSKPNDQTIALAVASDWHVFETVNPEEISGKNEYNPAIAKRSVENFFDGVLRWVEIHRHGTKINTLVLAILGDIITNMLHLDQIENNAGTPPEETLFGYDLLSGGIDYLFEKGEFELIEIPFVPGNHGRTTEKQRNNKRPLHTFEWLMAKFLQKRYKDEPRIKFNISTGIHLYMQIWDKIVRFHHGDSIKYQGGIGELTIPVNKAIRDWNTAQFADLDVFGHYHTTMDQRLFISNGSLLGYSPFTIAIKGKYEKPQQSIVMLNQKRWITSFNRIYVR